ncbi:GDP-mannose 4,6-dehydratase [bacterium]|nr:GDP-mannose 4,6-dehydratase [bacterium]
MNNKTWQKCLVTGGAGFIGSHLVDALLQQEKDVYVLDNLSTGKRENISQIKDNRFYQGCISNEKLLKDLLQKVDVVFHLAACVSVQESVSNPVKVNAMNAQATLKLFELCREVNPEIKIVQASSSAVYGDHDASNLHEQLTFNCKSMYALSKAQQEQFAELYLDSYGVRSVSLRFFNVFGPRQSIDSQYAAVIPNFFKAAIEGNQPVIYGDGSQTRDFVFVKDVVAANIAAANAEANGVFNVGAGHALSILQLWQDIASFIEGAKEPLFKDSRQGDVKHSVANVEKAKKQLSWQAQTDLYQNLQETFAWYQQHLA